MVSMKRTYVLMKESVLQSGCLPMCEVLFASSILVAVCCFILYGIKGNVVNLVIGLLIVGSVCIAACLKCCCDYKKNLAFYSKETSLVSIHTDQERNIRKLLTNCSKLDPSSQIYQYICCVITKSWLYNSRQGRDSVNLMHSGISPYAVVKVKNGKLWKKYSNKRVLMKTLYPLQLQNNPIITTNLESQILPVEYQLNESEVFLFHGAPVENVSRITRKGFDMRYARDGLYGQAIYLAESSEKADQYADEPSNRRMTGLAILIVRVTLGCVHTYKPPQDLGSVEQGAGTLLSHMENNNNTFNFETETQTTLKELRTFDSVDGHHDSGHCDRGHYDSLVAGLDKRFREFLIYDPDQCYPEFVVFYDRIKPTIPK